MSEVLSEILEAFCGLGIAMGLFYGIYFIGRRQEKKRNAPINSSKNIIIDLDDVESKKTTTHYKDDNITITIIKTEDKDSETKD